MLQFIHPPCGQISHLLNFYTYPIFFEKAQTSDGMDKQLAVFMWEGNSLNASIIYISQNNPSCTTSPTSIDWDFLANLHCFSSLKNIEGMTVHVLPKSMLEPKSYKRQWKGGHWSVHFTEGSGGFEKKEILKSNHHSICFGSHTHPWEDED